MKLGEIKIEALRLCFATPELSIDTEDEEVFTATLENISFNATYKDYISAMPGSINRCFSAIEHKKILRTKEKRYKKADLIVEDEIYQIPLDKKEMYDVESVTLISNGVIIHNVKYSFLSGDRITVLPIGEKDVYIVTYTPYIPRIKSYTSDSYEIDLSEDVLALIPYFIKGDIMRVDDPNEAAEARNIFEGMCAEIYRGVGKIQTEVDTVLSQEY